MNTRGQNFLPFVLQAQLCVGGKEQEADFWSTTFASSSNKLDETHLFFEGFLKLSRDRCVWRVSQTYGCRAYVFMDEFSRNSVLWDTLRKVEWTQKMSQIRNWFYSFILLFLLVYFSFSLKGASTTISWLFSICWIAFLLCLIYLTYQNLL